MSAWFLFGLLLYFRFVLPVITTENNDLDTDLDLDQDIIEEMLSLEATVQAQQQSIRSLQEINQRQYLEISSLTHELETSNHVESQKETEAEDGVPQTPRTEEPESPVVTNTFPNITEYGRLINKPARLRRFVLPMASSSVNTQPVAFHATFSSVSPQSVFVDQPITFNDVHLNLRNAFKTDRNAFVTPVSGVYLFSVSVEGAANSLAKVALTKNGERIAVAYSDSMDYDNAQGVTMYDQGAVTVALSLMKGDEVRVRAYLEPTQEISGGRNTMFSGVLMWEFE